MLAQEYLARASDDLEVCRLEIKSEDVFGFHIQQAIEKSIKAVIAAGGRVPPRDHDLVRLLDHLPPGTGKPIGVQELADLTPYGMSYRYPGADPPPQPLDRPAALASAEAAFTWATGRLR
jgi:HEPN domain-containing protein